MHDTRYQFASNVTSKKDLPGNGTLTGGRRAINNMPVELRVFRRRKKEPLARLKQMRETEKIKTPRSWSATGLSC